jgi:hypothetical protein
MLKTFDYTKANGDKSYRLVHPLHDVDDKELVLDFTALLETPELIPELEAQIEDIHAAYIKAIKDAGMQKYFRYFFKGNMKNVQAL